MTNSQNCGTCRKSHENSDSDQTTDCPSLDVLEIVSEIKESVDNVTLLDDPAPGVCPKCNSESMKLGDLDAHLILQCEKCHGLLVPSPDFADVVASRRRNFRGAENKPVPLDQNDLRKRSKCPQCLNEMDVHPYHGPGNVVIDSCEQCGLVWLDAGELAKIEGAPGRR